MMVRGKADLDDGDPYGGLVKKKGKKGKGGAGGRPSPSR